jgi:AcrR family transcriptional regulator
MEAARHPTAPLSTSAPTGRVGDVHEAALTLFAQWGYHGTTMSQIAETLGVRVPTLYSHIRSKQELLAEIMTTGSEQVWADYERAIDGAEGVTEQLRRAIEVYVHRHATHPREALIHNRDISSLEEPTRSEVLALRKRHQCAIRDLIDEGCSADVFAVENSTVASFAILEMGVSVARWFRDDGPLAPEDVARQYGQFAVSLVSRPAAP